MAIIHLKKGVNMKHIHIITYRGSFPMDTWNRLIRFLFDNKIPYKVESNISPTRDDAGLNKWYERIAFTHDTHVPYVTNRHKITQEEFLELIK
jgi:hypothetical protein